MKDGYHEYAWTVQKLEDGFYYFTDVGEPYGPHETEELALYGLECYESDYYND